MTTAVFLSYKASVYVCVFSMIMNFQNGLKSVAIQHHEGFLKLLDLLDFLKLSHLSCKEAAQTEEALLNESLHGHDWNGARTFKEEEYNLGEHKSGCAEGDSCGAVLALF